MYLTPHIFLNKKNTSSSYPFLGNKTHIDVDQEQCHKTWQVATVEKQYNQVLCAVKCNTRLCQNTNKKVQQELEMNPGSPYAVPENTFLRQTFTNRKILHIFIINNTSYYILIHWLFLWSKDYLNFLKQETIYQSKLESQTLKC